MAVKDYTKHYSELADAGSALPTPNTVSRHHKTGERSFTSVVSQSGKAILDSELQLGQDALKWETDQFRQWQGPSGWLRSQTRFDALNDYTTGTAPGGVSDDSGASIIDAGDRTMINGFLLPRLVAMVAGRPVVVEYTNTETADNNLVALPEPTIYDGTDGTVKRTDFVFLEVWLALVAPSPVASGTISVDGNGDITAGDTITIGGNVLTAVAAGAIGDQFNIGVDAATTAINIQNAINASATFNTTVTAAANDVSVTLLAVSPGAVGNTITLALAVTSIGCITISGGTLTGGEDRPSKPASEQGKVYRHGNVLSPASIWLDDEILNRDVGETAQRVQVQYRIRSTTAAQGINYKAHPDGFSNTVSPTLAQAGTAAPVANYPFVPADKTSTWLSSSAAAYGIEDPGLWVAGDGTATAAGDLGTLDGYVYAIPLCFVHRHNDCSDATAALQGFDPATNANGAPTYRHTGYTGNLGTIPAETSDRPDGGFSDVIQDTNILDLRRHVLLSGFHPESELQFQIQSLLDGNIRTWSVDIADKQVMGDDSGDVSTRYLVCDEIGRRAAPHADANPATTRGEFIRSFDHIARRFGAQSVVERVVFSFYPGDRAGGAAVGVGTVNPGKYVTKAGGAGDEWYEGDELHLDLTQFDASTLGSIFDGSTGGGSSAAGLADFDIAHFMPPGTVISDVLGAWHDDGNYDAAIDQSVQIAMIYGLGTQHLEIHLDANLSAANGGTPATPTYPLVEESGGATSSSLRRIFVEVEITYPLGQGTTCTPDLTLTPEATLYDGTSAGPGNQRPGVGPQIEADVTARPTDMESPKEPLFRSSYREIQLEYVANGASTHGVAAAGTPITDVLISRNQTDIYTPRRVYGGEAVVVTEFSSGTVRNLSATTEYGSSSRKLVTDTNLTGPGQTLCTVEYFPQDPIPNYGPLGNGYQVSVYYRSNAPQTAGVKDGAIGTVAGGVLPTSLQVEPISMSRDLWTSQVGPGSIDRAFPYALPTDQIPTNDNGTLNADWFYCATSNVAIADFDSNAGLLSLHPLVQADGQNVLQFGDNANPPEVDGEFRAFYDFAANWVYRPTVISQPLAGAVRHKVFFPFLARIVEETEGPNNGLLFRKNEVVLVVLCRHAELDADNSVRFTDASNTTAAAIYRTRNLLLVAGDRFTSVPSP